MPDLSLNSPEGSATEEPTKTSHRDLPFRAGRGLAEVNTRYDVLIVTNLRSHD